MTGVFITSSGTEIGKTLVTTLLIGQLRAAEIPVAAIKPVISGYDDESAPFSDSGLILKALGLRVDADSVAGISPWRFSAAISPDMAAAREGRHLDASEIADFCRAADRHGRVTLAEGIGGAMVPLNERETMLDVMAALGWPAILVVGSYLGTLSHTLTAVRALAAAVVPLAGVVVSESVESPVPLAETVTTLSRFIAAPVTGLLRFDPAAGPPACLTDLTALVTGEANCWCGNDP